MHPITRETRTLAHPAMPGPDPFQLMRSFLRWDPFRDMDFSLDAGASFTPSFDIRETPTAYLFEADLPGIRQEDLNIQLTGNRLAVTGRREDTHRRDEGNQFAMERSFGTFARSFSLPDGVDTRAIKADLDHGVLTVTLPKTPEIQARKIPIATEARIRTDIPEPGEDRPAPSMEDRGSTER
jgi:HSP20 family protein